MSAFVILICVANLYIYPYWQTPINSINVNHYLVVFILGTYAAFNYKKLSNYLDEKSVYLINLVILISILLMTPFSRHHLFGLPLDTSLANKYVYFGILWSLFIAISIEDTGIINKLFNNKFFHLLGVWSFSIYLFHWYIYMKMLEYWRDNFFGMLSAIIFAIVFGGIMYYLIELKCEILRKKITNKITVLYSQYAKQSKNLNIM